MYRECREKTECVEWERRGPPAGVGTGGGAGKEGKGRGGARVEGGARAWHSEGRAAGAKRAAHSWRGVWIEPVGMA